MTKILGFICKNLSTTPWTPKSGEHDDHILPFLEDAKKGEFHKKVLETFPDAELIDINFKKDEN